MALFELKEISLHYGTTVLLDAVALTLEDNERIALLGRNGCGKSTLLKLIAGEIQADDGTRVGHAGVTLARLTQEVPAAIDGTVFEVIAAGTGTLGAVLQRYHALGQQLASLSNATGDQSREINALMHEMEPLQQQLDNGDGWQINHRVETIVARLGLPADKPFNELSGGYRRRVLLGQALVSNPALLLLDEPTNHLDIDSILWLEEFLRSWRGTLLFISHDRRFIESLATRILELDRGHLHSWPGDYQNFLRRKQELLAAEESANALEDKKLAKEEIWIRQGIKARRTRNEGRVRQLKKLREERRQRRELSGNVKLQVDDKNSSGQRVVTLDKVSKSYAGRVIVRDLSTTILRGDKVGILGPNGAGKSTLIKLILGQIAADNGEVTMGSRVEIAYFDQNRDQLNGALSVAETVADGGDFIEVNGNRRHVMSYLSDFLFTPDRARAPVRSLSGGECNRLLLAKLFAHPFNLLVMDEPTNDLDMETLDLLEETLLDYSGTLLLVS
ncbi:MAG: ATP-binding cassette domain-containing protein, partial [Gammaproteobacteria bacterium]|nr:ATP-binding cassette domain-containing protein [Gammaproteobacteria bacterium]